MKRKSSGWYGWLLYKKNTFYGETIELDESIECVEIQVTPAQFSTAWTNVTTSLSVWPTIKTRASFYQFGRIVTPNSRYICTKSVDQLNFLCYLIYLATKLPIVFVYYREITDFIFVLSKFEMNLQWQICKMSLYCNSLSRLVIYLLKINKSSML